MVRSVALALLMTVLAMGDALAEPCSPEAAKSAVEAAIEMVGRLGVEAAKDLIDRKEGPYACGGYSVKVMDYSGTWLIDPDAESNVGRNVASYNDGAATNFMKGLIAAAIERQGQLLAYMTSDTGRGGVKVDKALYWAAIPQRKVMVYGAFIVTP